MPPSPSPFPSLPTTLDEAHALILLLVQESQFLRERVTHLEERLRNDSSNSSKPPSSDPPWMKKGTAPPESSPKRSRGGQKGHRGSSRRLASPEQIHIVHPCPPDPLCPCGGSVRVDARPSFLHQVFELPRTAPEITEYRLFRGTCSACGRRPSGRLPPEAPSGTLGPRAMATLAVLTGQYHLSKRDVVAIFRDQFGIPLSKGTVCAAEARVRRALLDPNAEILAYLAEQAVIHLDETGHKVAGKRGWMWAQVSDRAAAFTIRRSRGADVARELLGKGFDRYLVTDRWNAYRFVDPTRRQLCWAHLLRDLVKITERGHESERIGNALREQARQMFEGWHALCRGPSTRKEFQAFMVPIEQRIHALLVEGSLLLSSAKTRRTCANLLILRGALFTFVTVEGMEPTNNKCEQALRDYVIWRKTSFGTQSPSGNEYVERILTLIATCKRQGRNIFDHLTEIIHAQIHHLPSPPLCIS